MNYASFLDRVNEKSIGLFKVLPFVVLGLGFIITLNGGDFTEGGIMILIGAASIALMVNLRRCHHTLKITDIKGECINLFHKIIRIIVSSPLKLIIFFYFFYIYFLLGERTSILNDSLLLSLFIWAVFIESFWLIPIFFTKEKLTLQDWLCRTRVMIIPPEKTPPQWIKYFRPLLHLTSFSMMFILLSFSIWVIYASLDEKLNPNFETFYAQEPFSPEDNFYVGWSGLYAPAGTKDIYDYGLKVINNEIEWDRDKALSFKGRTDNLHFFHENPLATNIERRAATPEKEILQLAQDNQELIARYKSFYSYSNFDRNNLRATPERRAQNLIDINMLLANQWVSMAQDHDNADKALQEWSGNTIFIQDLMASNHGLVEHAVWMILYGRALETLPWILKDNPELTQRWAKSLEKILRFNSSTPEIWANVTRGEFTFYRQNFDFNQPNTLFYKQNITKNGFYNWAQDFTGLAEHPPQNFDLNLEKVLKKHPDYEGNKFKILSKNAVGNLLISGALEGGALIKNAYRYNAQSRALILYIRAKSQNIPPEKMKESLGAAPESLYDPFTGKPFQWDVGIKSIYFSKDKETRKDLYYE